MALLQVRRMTGALVAVGQGQLSVPQMKEILEARDSRAYPVGMTAPARGLFLTRVDYRETGEEESIVTRSQAETYSAIKKNYASVDFSF